jgi:hypothetical protein
VTDSGAPPLPEAFVALFVLPGRQRPTASRAHIAERHELCEDLAQMLTETARQRLWELGITEDLVLERIHAGLPETGLALTPAEAWWVTRRSQLAARVGDVEVAHRQLADAVLPG